jgi:hypothetical protein
VDFAPQLFGENDMPNFVKTHVTFRVTEEEFDMISELARASHLPVSTFIKREMRQLAHKSGLRAHADASPITTTTIIPAKSAARPATPTATPAALDALFSDVDDDPHGDGTREPPEGMFD